MSEVQSSIKLPRKISDGRIVAIVRHEVFWSVLILTALLGGCTRHHMPPRIVYVPAPAPEASQTASQQAGTLVIEQTPPPSPQPTEPEPSQEEEAKPVHRTRPVIRRRLDKGKEQQPGGTGSQTSSEVPALESRQQPKLRQEIAGLQNNVQQRITQLDHANLSSADRTTLETARSFLAQSVKALAEGDFERSFTLARKASLLVGSLEEPH